MNHKLLLDTAVLAGEIMLCSGAETYRVEDTMYHILKTSKAESIEALALMTGIMATINSPDMEQPMTVIKAVNNRTTNLNHVIQVNDISRRYCGGELTLEETYQALRKIGGMQYNRTLCNAALVGVAAGFAMMFGGSFLDVAATAVVGVLLAAIITLGEKVKMNVIIIDILSSIGIAILAIAMKTYGMKEINMDTVIISAIMPLVPGVAITNAIRDTLQWESVWRYLEQLREGVSYDCTSIRGIYCNFYICSSAGDTKKISWLCGNRRCSWLAGVSFERTCGSGYSSCHLYIGDDDYLNLPHLCKNF